MSILIYIIFFNYLHKNIHNFQYNVQNKTIWQHGFFPSPYMFFCMRTCIGDLFCFCFAYFITRILVREVHVDAVGP